MGNYMFGLQNQFFLLAHCIFRNENENFRGYGFIDGAQHRESWFNDE